MNNYTFYEDAGHGWLKVPISKLFELGIADKISPYSYMGTNHAFLEEDCDLTVFIERLLELEGIKVVGVPMASEDFEDFRYICFMRSFWSDCDKQYAENSQVRDYASYDYSILARRMKNLAAKTAK